MKTVMGCPPLHCNGAGDSRSCLLTHYANSLKMVLKHCCTPFRSICPSPSPSQGVTFRNKAFAVEVNVKLHPAQKPFCLRSAAKAGREGPCEGRCAAAHGCAGPTTVLATPVAPHWVPCLLGGPAPATCQAPRSCPPEPSRMG